MKLIKGGKGSGEEECDPCYTPKVMVAWGMELDENADFMNGLIVGQLYCKALLFIGGDLSLEELNGSVVWTAQLEKTKKIAQMMELNVEFIKIGELSFGAHHEKIESFQCVFSKIEPETPPKPVLRVVETPT